MRNQLPNSPEYRDDGTLKDVVLLKPLGRYPRRIQARVNGKTSTLYLHRVDFNTQYAKAVAFIAQQYHIKDEIELTRLKGTEAHFITRYGLNETPSFPANKLAPNEIEQHPQVAKLFANAAIERVSGVVGFNKDGTLKHVTLGLPVGKNLLRIQATAGKKRMIASIANADFASQYSRVVEFMIKTWGVLSEDERAKMRASAPAFLRRYNLRLVPISHDVTVAVPRRRLDSMDVAKIQRE
jgi:hypothetical protein